MHTSRKNLCRGLFGAGIGLMLTLGAPSLGTAAGAGGDIPVTPGAEPPRWPLNIEISPSSSFAEFRGLRFHGGVDLRTRMATGFPVVACADGFVSRLKIQHRGFGYAAYVDHPALKARSVYGHLKDFAGPMAEYARKKLKEMNAFYGVDDSFGADRFPVKKGEVIGFSGDTGLGPAHLHFELRTLKDEPISPSVLGMRVPDSLPPKLQALFIDPLSATARVNGALRPATLPLRKSGPGQYAWSGIPKISERVGLSLGLVDLGEGDNRFGVERIEVLLDGQPLFHRTFDWYSYDENSQCPWIYDVPRTERGGAGYVYTLFRWPWEKLHFSKGIEPWGGIIGRQSPGIHRLSINAVDFGGNAVAAEGQIEIEAEKREGRVFSGRLVPRGYCSTPFSLVVECAAVAPIAAEGCVLAQIRDGAGNTHQLPAWFGRESTQVAFPIAPEWAQGGFASGSQLLPPLVYVDEKGGEVSLPEGPKALFPGGALHLPVFAWWQARPDLTGLKQVHLRSKGWQLFPETLVAETPFRIEIPGTGGPATAKWGLYERSPKGGYGFCGGEALSSGLKMTTRAIGPVVILEDEVLPKIRFLGQRQVEHLGKCWVYTVSDIGSGVDDGGYHVLIDGTNGRFDTDPDKAELYVVRPKEGKRHQIDITVVDRAGNRKQIREER